MKSSAHPAVHETKATRGKNGKQVPTLTFTCSLCNQRATVFPENIDHDNSSSHSMQVIGSDEEINNMEARAAQRNTLYRKWLAYRRFLFSQQNSSFQCTGFCSSSESTPKSPSPVCAPPTAGVCDNDNERSLEGEMNRDGTPSPSPVPVPPLPSVPLFSSWMYKSLPAPNTAARPISGKGRTAPIVTILPCQYGDHPPPEMEDEHAYHATSRCMDHPAIGASIRRADGRKYHPLRPSFFAHWETINNFEQEACESKVEPSRVMSSKNMVIHNEDSGIVLPQCNMHDRSLFKNAVRQMTLRYAAGHSRVLLSPYEKREHHEQSERVVSPMYFSTGIGSTQQFMPAQDFKRQTHVWKSKWTKSLQSFSVICNQKYFPSADLRETSQETNENIQAVQNSTTAKKNSQKEEGFIQLLSLWKDLLQYDSLVNKGSYKTSSTKSWPDLQKSPAATTSESLVRQFSSLVSFMNRNDIATSDTHHLWKCLFVSSLTEDLNDSTQSLMNLFSRDPAYPLCAKCWVSVEQPKLDDIQTAVCEAYKNALDSVPFQLKDELVQFYLPSLHSQWRNHSTSPGRRELSDAEVEYNDIQQMLCGVEESDSDSQEQSTTFTDHDTTDEEEEKDEEEEDLMGLWEKVLRSEAEERRLEETLLEIAKGNSSSVAPKPLRDDVTEADKVAENDEEFLRIRSTSSKRTTADPSNLADQFCDPSADEILHATLYKKYIRWNHGDIPSISLPLNAISVRESTAHYSSIPISSIEIDITRVATSLALSRYRSIRSQSLLSLAFPIFTNTPLDALRVALPSPLGLRNPFLLAFLTSHSQGLSPSLLREDVEEVGRIGGARLGTSYRVRPALLSDTRRNVEDSVACTPVALCPQRHTAMVHQSATEEATRDENSSVALHRCFSKGQSASYCITDQRWPIFSIQYQHQLYVRSLLLKKVTLEWEKREKEIMTTAASLISGSSSSVIPQFRAASSCGPAPPTASSSIRPKNSTSTSIWCQVPLPELNAALGNLMECVYWLQCIHGCTNSCFWRGSSSSFTSSTTSEFRVKLEPFGSQSSIALYKVGSSSESSTSPAVHHTDAPLPNGRVSRWSSWWSGYLPVNRSAVQPNAVACMTQTSVINTETRHNELDQRISPLNNPLSVSNEGNSSNWRCSSQTREIRVPFERVSTSPLANSSSVPKDILQGNRKSRTQGDDESPKPISGHHSTVPPSSRLSFYVKDSIQSWFMEDFGEACVIFVDVVRQIVSIIEKKLRIYQEKHGDAQISDDAKSVNLKSNAVLLSLAAMGCPYSIQSSGVVGGCSVRRGSVQEHVWTTGMKHLLTIVQWCFYVSSELDNEYCNGISPVHDPIRI